MGQLDSIVRSALASFPTSSQGAGGVNQGADGMAQGPTGAAIGAALGPQIGMQRAALGGMNPPAAGGNPNAPAIDGLNAAQMPNLPVPHLDLAALFQRIANRPPQTGQMTTQGGGGPRPW